MDGEKEVSILGGRHQGRARVERVDSFSGHAGHSELLAYFERIGGPKRNVWLVHGERDRAEVLRDALVKRHPGVVEVARAGETVEFG